MTFVLAIIGRPNVGKSTLFNRLVGRKLAIVSDEPGVTRDWREGEAEFGDLSFLLLDTAGHEGTAGDETLALRMSRQTERALEMANAALLVIDGRAGLTEADRSIADIVRKSGRPVILCANKCEGRAGESGLLEAYELGLGEPIALSAEHGDGTADLYARLEPLVRSAGEEGDDVQFEDGEDEDRALRVAIVGRPNTGKSTLINRLLGEERLLTGPEAGITRDAISVEWEYEGRRVKLFDTAGMRRKYKVQEKLEQMSVGETLRAIRFAEVVVVLLDATQSFEKQDLQIADLVEREGRAVIVALNKWDLVEDPDITRREAREKLDRLLPQIKGTPLVTLSAREGRGVDRLMPAIEAAYERWTRRVPTAALNRWFADAIEEHRPPAARGRPVRLRYITQIKARPPTFAVFSSRANAFPESYKRYLVNGLRDAFGLEGVPIRLMQRKGKNPYADKG